MINVTQSTSPTFSSAIAVAGRNEAAAETHPMDVVQKLLNNDKVNPWQISADVTIRVPVSAVTHHATLWSIPALVNVIPALEQGDPVTVSHLICDISAVIPPDLSGTLKIKGVSISLRPTPSHSNLPVSMPQIVLDSYPAAEYSSTAATFTEIATARDESATIGAYETPHILPATCSHLIVSSERYFLRILGEHSTNSLAGLVIANIFVTVGH